MRKMRKYIEMFGKSSMRWSIRQDISGCHHCFPSKWCLKNERRNSMLMKCHYPVMDKESFSALFPQTSTRGASQNVCCFLRLHFPPIFTQSTHNIKKLYFYLEFYGAFCWYNTMIMRTWKHCINISSSWWLKYLERCVNLLTTKNSFN